MEKNQSANAATPRRSSRVKAAPIPIEIETVDPIVTAEPGPQGTGADQSVTDRAEESLDQIGERVGKFAASAGQYLRRFTARSREEAEDIWAEAQQLRGRDEDILSSHKN